MSEKKARTPNVWETKGGFKPDWAHEIDVERGQRSDSERFEHALDMGITAAETLKRDEALGLTPSKERLQRHVVLAVIAVLVCVGILLAFVSGHKDKKEPVPQQAAQEQVEMIQPEKHNDGSYHVHATMVAGDKGKEDTQTIAIPEKAATGAEPWVMRVHATVDQSSKDTPSCEMKMSFTDSYKLKNSVSYPDYCHSTDQASVDFLVPLFPNTDEYVEYPLQKGDTVLIVTGKSAELDIDFLPASTIADTWNTSETLTGNETTIVAFSGSLADFKFHKFSCSAVLYAYKPDLKKWVLLNKKYSTTFDFDTERIKESGLDKDDASGYLFIEMDGHYLNQASWRLN